jgi:hypothetical protein
VHVERVAFNPCERGASLQWQGDWLVSDNSEGNLAAVDTAGRFGAIELGGLVKRVRGVGTGFSAYWSDRPPEP